MSAAKLQRYFTAYTNDPMSKIVLMRGQERVPGKDEPKPDATPREMLKAAHRGSMWSFQSPAGTQRKFLVQLDKVFDLATNGEYVVQAMRTIPSLDKTSEKQVVSGKATFRVTDPPSSPASHQ